jgi:hypothetical protein
MGKNAFSRLNSGNGEDDSVETILNTNKKLTVKWYAERAIQTPAYV